MKKPSTEALIYTCLVIAIPVAVYFFVYASLATKSNIIYKEGDFSSYFPNSQTKVILYGTSWCQACATTRRYLTSKHVDFIDYDIDSSEEAKRQYSLLRGKAVPLLLIGNRRLEGFNSKAVSEALEKLQQGADLK